MRKKVTVRLTVDTSALDDAGDTALAPVDYVQGVVEVGDEVGAITIDSISPDADTGADDDTGDDLDDEEEWHGVTDDC